MRFLFRKKWKGARYTDKLPWLAIQADLLEIRLSNTSLGGGSRNSSRSSSRSSSPSPGHEGVGAWWWYGRGWAARVVQMALVVLVCVAALQALLSSPSPQTPLTQPLLSATPPTHLPLPPPGRLLDLEEFGYVSEGGGPCEGRVYFLVVVHSRPDHFRQRHAIRQSWGRPTSLPGGWTTRTVFMLGQGHGGGGDEAARRDGLSGLWRGGVQALVDEESRRWGDLVVGDFVDHYHNLTYKHVMSLRWAATRCPNANYIIKADDDAFVDVLALRALLERTFPGPQPRTLACNVLPGGTAPQREGKWAVSKTDYPWPEYPPYCAGLAYVATPDVADMLWRGAHADVAPRVWVDDVWVTGLVAAALGLRHHYLNLRYSFDHNDMSAWVQRARPSAAPPFTFAHLDPACSDWPDTLHQLWHHALAATNTTHTPAHTDADDTQKHNDTNNGHASTDPVGSDR